MTMQAILPGTGFVRLFIEAGVVEMVRRDIAAVA